MKQLFSILLVTRHFLLIVVACGALFLNSCNEYGNDPEPFPAVSDVAAFDATIATDWMDMMMRASTRTPGYTPPVAARAYAYAGITLHESVVHGMINGRSLAGQIHGLDLLPLPETNKRYHWAIVANSAMAEMMRSFYPFAPDSIKQSITNLESRELAERTSFGIDAEIIKRSIAYGKDVAQIIIAYAQTDGGDKAYTKNFPASFVPQVGPGLWVPTPPAMQPIPLQPYWGKNRPFVLPVANPIAQCDPGTYPDFSTDSMSAFYQSAHEVYTTVRNLTPEQRYIAKFWSDDPGTTPTPAGHSISILTQLIKEHGKNLEFAVRAYAQVGIAVNDAFIGCWAVKYKYNLMRPISYIQQNIDPTWNRDSITDPLITPPFPEYVSGHSVQGGAAFEIMKALFGNIGFADKSHVNRGFEPRWYSSITEAMQENGISRLYGGIHYRFAIDRGVTMGNEIGQSVMSTLKFTK